MTKKDLLIQLIQPGQQVKLRARHECPCSDHTFATMAGHFGDAAVLVHDVHETPVSIPHGMQLELMTSSGHTRRFAIAFFTLAAQIVA